MSEIADFVCISCDGLRALVEFDTWSPISSTYVPVRVSYGPGHDRLVLEASPCPIAARFVLESNEALADVIETCSYQRDVLREKN